MGGSADGLEDLGPLPLEQRTWRWHTFVAMWVVIGTNAGAYSFGGSLVALGLGPAEALACAAIGLVIATGAIILNSVPGVAYSIPFPVYARAAFGYHGAKYAAVTRGVVGAFWLSFQMWVGASSLFSGLARAAPGIEDWAPLWEPYLSCGQLVLLILVALLHAALIAAGVRYFDKFAYVMSIPAVVFFALIAVWAVTPSWGGATLDEMFRGDLGGDAAEGHDHGPLSWIAAINSTVSLWSTLILNIADLSRLAAQQRQQVIGQLLGVPLPQLAGMAVGVLGASAVQAKSGKASWLPTDLFQYWNPWAAVIGGLLIMTTLLALNIGANIIPPANDFMNLSPDRLRWRWCAYGTIVFAVLCCPFYLFYSATGFALRFLGGYGMATGAIFGVMVTDYYILRGGHLSLDDLYPEAPGRGAYAYWHGHNWRAALAVLAGIALPLPAWIADLVGAPPLGLGWVIFEKTSWFVAALVSAVVYEVACLLAPPPLLLAESPKRSPRLEGC